MQRIQSFTELDQLPSATLNTWQDTVAPAAPFPGYRRGGDMYTKNDGTTKVYFSPMMLCMGANCDSVASNAAETFVDWNTFTTANVLGYVYAKITAGVIVYNIYRSTDANSEPAADLVFKVNDTTSRYLGCIFPDNGNVVLPFNKVGTRYEFTRSQVASTKFLFCALAAAAAFAAKNLTCTTGAGPLVPPHVRMVHLMLQANNTGAAGARASSGVRTTGDTGFESGRAYVQNVAGGAETNETFCTLECSAGQQVDIDLVTAGGGTCSSNSYVCGFEERSV